MKAIFDAVIAFQLVLICVGVAIIGNAALAVAVVPLSVAVGVYWLLAS